MILSVISIPLLITFSFSISVSKGFSNGFIFEYDLKGKDLIMTLFSSMGILGMVPTGQRGHCSRKPLKCNIIDAIIYGNVP